MTTFTYTKPTVGGSEDAWGDTLNANWDAIAAFIGPLDSTELAVLDGITASTAELNLLDGVTVTLADITATAAEINYLSGVTSAVQDQIDNIPAPPELTQAQVEDDTSTVFGQVSGQRLGQAVAANAVTIDYGAGNAALLVGAIGTYALLKYNSSSPPTLSAGATAAGSNLRYAGAVTANYSGSSGPTAGASGVPAGTWRIMGLLAMAGGLQINNASLYLRIS